MVIAAICTGGAQNTTTAVCDGGRAAQKTGPAANIKFFFLRSLLAPAKGEAAGGLCLLADQSAGSRAAAA